MRPSGIESVRAVQAALAGVIAPELTAAFAQDSAQVLQMLMESIAAEWDTAADDLRRDNEELRVLLNSSLEAMKSGSGRNESFAPIVSEIERRLSEDGGGESISISALSARNDALRETLELVLMAFEDWTGQAGFESIESVRGDIYTHLRHVAARGWSFWDLSSFRGRMTAIQQAAQRDDGSQTRGVE